MLLLQLICLVTHVWVGRTNPHNVVLQARAKNVAAAKRTGTARTRTNICGDSTDPNFLPFPNMAAALNGYDLPKGDPFSSTLVDPGWRHQIFEHTRRDDRGCTVPAFGITSTDLNSCSGRFRSEVLTSYKGYRDQKLKSFSSGFDLQWGNEVEAGVGNGGVSASTTIPPMITRSSTEAESEGKISSFFSQENGVMVSREALCLTHRLFIDNFDIPPFTRGFNLSVQALYNAPESRRAAEFKRFISSYGTHYSSETQLGAKFSHFRRYSGVDRKTQNSNTFKKCSDLKGTRIFWFQVEEDEAECQQFYQENIDFNSEQVDESYWITYGSRPAETLIEWAQQSLNNPIPIRMKFQPIPNLFTDELMARIDPKIDATLLKSWFIPLYLDTCNQFNLDCASKLGCGLSDDCKWEDACAAAPNSPGGYRCYKYILGNANEDCNRACERKLGRACDFATVNSLRDTEIRDILVSLDPQASCTAQLKAPTWFDHPLLFGDKCHGWGTRDTSTKKAECSYLNPKTGSKYRRLCECDQHSCTDHVCHNGGKCLTANGGRHTCQCNPGFSGPKCQDSNFILGTFGESCTSACRRVKNKPCNLANLNAMSGEDIKQIFLSLDGRAQCTESVKDPKWFDHPLLYGTRAQVRCHGWNTRTPDSVKATCEYVNPKTGREYRRLCECVG